MSASNLILCFQDQSVRRPYMGKTCPIYHFWFPRMSNGDGWGMHRSHYETQQDRVLQREHGTVVLPERVCRSLCDTTGMVGFRSLPSWIDECKLYLLVNDIPWILLGNQCDLRSAIWVPADSARKFAELHNILLFESSGASYFVST